MSQNKARDFANGVWKICYWRDGNIRIEWSRSLWYDCKLILIRFIGSTDAFGMRSKRGESTTYQNGKFGQV